VISIEDQIGSIKTIFLDTAPVIYYVENKQPFSPLLEPFFAHIDRSVLTAVTSPITLAECLFYPYKKQNIQLATAVAASCDAFLTNDKQLKRVTELQIIVIDELTVSS
jgi:predicted nucleic acid-binding protein